MAEMTDELEKEMKAAAQYFATRSADQPLTGKSLDEKVEIFVMDNTGKTITVYIRLDQTVGQLKELVENKTGVPREDQRLTFNGKELLQEDRSLHGYHIEELATMHLVLKLRGEILDPIMGTQMEDPDILPEIKINTYPEVIKCFDAHEDDPDNDNPLTTPLDHTLGSSGRNLGNPNTPRSSSRVVRGAGGGQKRSGEFRKRTDSSSSDDSAVNRRRPRKVLSALIPKAIAKSKNRDKVLALDSLNLLHNHTLLSTSSAVSSMMKSNYNEPSMTAMSNSYFKPSLQPQSISAITSLDMAPPWHKFMGTGSDWSVEELESVITSNIDRNEIVEMELALQKETLKDNSNIRSDNVMTSSIPGYQGGSLAALSIDFGEKCNTMQLEDLRGRQANRRRGSIDSGYPSAGSNESSIINVTPGENTAGKDNQQPEQPQETKSFKYDECEKQVKDADDVELQPAKKEHSSFSESSKDIKLLMREEKGQQLANNNMKTRLREMCVTYGRTSENVQEFCKLISKRFLQVHGVIESYPAYTIGNETNIVFVLTIKDNITDIHQQLVEFNIDTIIKTVSSAICEDDLAITEDFRENYKDMERLEECILKNTEDLMQQHKYLNVIRGGSNKQKKGSKRELCIVLYVHAKGFIPIDEDPFKKSYDGIHVKVLEGRFTPYMNHGEEVRLGSFTPSMNHADVALNKLRMGCKIEGHNNGTLGVFIEHPSYGLCGITCAHVALSATDMEECKSENGRLLWGKIHPSKKYIHQPSRINDDLNQFGQIVEVIYKEGKGSETGIEIALIQIEKRHPDSGKFSTPRSDSVESDFEFASGKTCGPTRFNTNYRCFKVGSVTGFTEGTIEMCAPNTVRTDKHKWDYDHLRITLYNQIFVRPIQEEFASFGDSGAPVFVKEEATGELVCIGLVEGGLTDGLVVVTPITKILEELGISHLKAFPQNVMQELQQIKQQQLQIKSTLNVVTTQLNVFQAQYEELIQQIKQNNRTHTT